MSPMQQYPRRDQTAQHYQKPNGVESSPRPAIPTSSFSSPIRRPSQPHRMMPQYTSRDVGDPSQIKKTKQSMADLKLRRLTELNNRLREDLERERIPVSSAAKGYVTAVLRACDRGNTRRITMIDDGLSLGSRLY